MPDTYINRIATAVPQHDMHEKFVAYAPTLLADERARQIFRRMAERAQIEHRYSCLPPDPRPDQLDTWGFYVRGRFPDTAARMKLYEAEALPLACRTVAGLECPRLAEDVTHLIVASCTGFYAPGLDLQLIEHFGLQQSVERTIVGFMGCYAAMNALKLAHHMIRSDPAAVVLVINIELCTLHLQDTPDLERVLSFLIFGDGCSACLVSAEPSGIRLDAFRSTILPSSADQITWRIGLLGFDMMLSGRVAQTLARNLQSNSDAILFGHRPDEVGIWAIHPGGRSVLDAAEEALHLKSGQLAHSRSVLQRYGNMSSATVMFVLKDILATGLSGLGCAMAFGPGITAESMLFEVIV